MADVTNRSAAKLVSMTPEYGSSGTVTKVRATFTVDAIAAVEHTLKEPKYPGEVDWNAVMQGLKETLGGVIESSIKTTQ